MFSRSLAALVAALLFVASGAGAAIAATEGAEPPKLKSSAVLVIDEASGEVLYGKNAETVAPIASITKVMTAMVILDAGLPLDQELTISMEDVEATRPTRSRLRPGYGLTRSDLLLLALMSSDNRAAVALGRTYPGGMQAFVEAMNVKARMLDMTDSRFVEPSGLASENVSSARDLAKLVRAARQYPLISEYSTRTDHEIQLGKRKEKFVNTNGLVRAGSWDIDLSKTGFIREAGRCLVMYAKLAARPVIIVLLDSFGKYTRLADAEQIRAWLEPGYTPPAGLTRAATGSRKAASTKSPRKSAGAIHSVSSPSRVRSEFKTQR